MINEEDNISKRLGDYFEHLLNEENPRIVFGDGVPNQILAPEISREEVVKALKKMKTEKRQDLITSP